MGVERLLERKRENQKNRHWTERQGSRVIFETPEARNGGEIEKSAGQVDLGRGERHPLRQSREYKTSKNEGGE